MTEQPEPNPDQDQRYDSVVAKLNRPPQDELQAAVVLEAWGGSKAPDSFAITPHAGADTDPDFGQRSSRWGLGPRRVGEMAVMATVVLMAIIWIPMLRDVYGRAATVGVIWGLPLALAADSAIRTRYLGSGTLLSLRRTILPFETSILAAGFVVAVMDWGGMIEVQLSAVIAASVAVIWGHVSILSGREWYWAYGLLALVATLAMWSSESRLAILVLTAVVVMALATVAVRRSSGDSISRPESWQVALAAAVIGAGSGFILVADLDSLQPPSTIVAIALVILTVAGWVGSIRVSRLWFQLPRQMEKLVLREHGSESVSDVFRRTALGAGAVVALPTTLLVITAVVVQEDEGVPVLISYGLFTLASLIVSLNLVSRRWFVTAGVVGLAAGVALILAQTIPGLALAGGSAVIILVGGMIALVTYRDAAATYSTRMMLQ